MASEFKLCAEEIVNKLSLIDENKNLLPYPYGTALPAALVNVGDGSILTTGDTTSSGEILLNTCSLLAGTYISSLEVADAIDSLKAVTNPGFGLKVTIDGVDQSTSFTLSTEKSAYVYLVVPAGCTTKNLLIKPQLEKGEEKTAWVPNMDKIGTYIDRRFNGTNAKLRDVLAFMNLVEIVDTE